MDSNSIITGFGYYFIIAGCVYFTAEIIFTIKDFIRDFREKEK
jgi:hypothetical protein